MALESDVSGAVLNVGTGISTTIRDLARILIQHMGSTWSPSSVLAPCWSRAEPPISVALPAILGWQPTIDVEDGLRQGRCRRVKSESEPLTRIQRRAGRDYRWTIFDRPPSTRVSMRIPYNPHAWIIGTPRSGEGLPHRPRSPLHRAAAVGAARMRGAQRASSRKERICGRSRIYTACADQRPAEPGESEAVAVERPTTKSIRQLWKAISSSRRL